jgi:hypothetical protein
VSVDDDERRAAKESPRRLDRYLDVVIGPVEFGPGVRRVLERVAHLPGHDVEGQLEARVGVPSR